MGKKIKKETEASSKDAFDPLSIESKTAATVVLMISSPEEEVLSKACEAIHKYAEKGDENRGTLLGLGVMEPLSRLISHADRLVRRTAVMALGVMVANHDVKSTMKKLNIIPSIISKLSPGEEVVVHEFATLCLASLSIEFTHKVQIFESGGLDPLIKLLSSPDPDVKKNSVECIYNLVQDLPSRLAVHQLNGVPPLLELLRSEFPVIQLLALQTLRSITADARTRSALREGQGFDRLLEVLTTKEFSDLHVEALQVVANCLEDLEAMHVIRETGGLEKLLQFVVTPNLPEVQTNAAKAISRMAQSKGIGPIVQLLSGESGEVREAATLALSSLTNGNQPNACAVYAAEGGELLVQLLQDRCPGTVAHAAATLTNTATQEQLRCSIRAHGALQALVEPLQDTDARELASAALAVAALTCEADGRTDFRNAGGLPPLVRLLSSNNAEVRRSACWAVRVCANDEPTAIEMCKLGALEILQEINLSTNRKNQFSEAALRQLLDCNLSVKYSLTGCLSPSNITTDGFYDPGQARTGHKVLALEDLSKQGVNPHRPIIVVNGKPLGSAEVVDDKQLDSPSDTRSSSVLGKGIGKTQSSKGKNKGRREDQKQKDEEERKPRPEATVGERPWTLPYDAAFHSLVTEAAKSILPLREEREQHIALAKLVSEAMGGPVDRETLYDFPWELHLSELKFQLQSNVIPIGKIRKGTFYHRALLFKALADRVGMSCSLIRGDYNRAWNEVRLSEGPPEAPGCHPQPQIYIVDLMHSPGLLLKSGSPGADQYQRI